MSSSADPAACASSVNDLFGSIRMEAGSALGSSNFNYRSNQSLLVNESGTDRMNIQPMPFNWPFNSLVSESNGEQRASQASNRSSVQQNLLSYENPELHASIGQQLEVLPEENILQERTEELQSGNHTYDDLGAQNNLLAQ